MKKRILIMSTVLTGLCLTTFGFMKSNQDIKIASCKLENDQQPGLVQAFIFPEEDDDDGFDQFFYNVSTRFAPVTKGAIDRAQSIVDFLPKTQTQGIDSYKSVKIFILDDFRQTEVYEVGTSDVLTEAQINLLRSATYSANILVRADYQLKYGTTTYDRYFTPHLTIVPEKQAYYMEGHEALITYLKSKSQDLTASLPTDKLKAGKIYFTINPEGKLTNPDLKASCGFAEIDSEMIKLIKTTPGKWSPAVNEKGEKVSQKLVFSFGIIGC